MSSQLIESHREKAVVYTGLGICKQKVKELLKKFSFPHGVLFLDNVVEFGYNESTGFIWLKRDKKTEQVHPKLGSKGSFEMEVTAFIEEKALKQLKGFKVKELLIWISVNAVQISGPNFDKVNFSSLGGISRSFPISKVELDD